MGVVCAEFLSVMDIGYPNGDIYYTLPVH